MSKKQEKLIKSHLYRRIKSKIPSSNEHLLNIISIHAREEDGDRYRALYSIVYRCTKLLDKYRSEFGPKWNDSHDPTSYAQALLTETETQAMTSSVHYSPAEISLEMLNRAVEANHKKVTATNFIQAIHKWDEEKLSKKEHFPYQYRLENLAHALAKSNEPNDGEQIERTIINAIRRNSSPTNPNTTSNAGKRRYSKDKMNSPAGKVQCDACHQFGHSIGFEGKPCHFCAQLYWTTKFMGDAENESAIKKNAELYNIAQRPSIAQISADHFENDSTADEETIENHSINLVAVTHSFE